MRLAPRFFWFPADLRMMRDVLELELHQEIESTELLSHENTQMMLLEGNGRRRVVGRKSEIIIAVEVDAAEQVVANRVHRFLLRLGLLLEFLAGHTLGLFLELLDLLDQAGDDGLLVGQFCFQPGELILLRPCGPTDGKGHQRRQPEGAFHALLHFFTLFQSRASGEVALLDWVIGRSVRNPQERRSEASDARDR